MGPEPSRSRSAWPRLALTLVVGVSLVAAGALALAKARPQSIESGQLSYRPDLSTTGSTTFATTVPDISGPTVPSTDSVTVSPGERLGSGLPLGPVRASQREAAQAFLDLLGVGPTELTVSGNTVEVHPKPAGAASSDEVAILGLVEAKDDEGTTGWAVTTATSSEVTIEQLIVDGTPAAGFSPAEGSELLVSGRGTGFEGSVTVDLRPSSGGAVLAETGTPAGNGAQRAAFSATLPLVGTEAAWVVVWSDVGDDQTVPHFAAEPLIYRGPPDTTDYVVTRIPDNDPDKGLNLRAGPSKTTRVLDVVERGAAVTRTPGMVPSVQGNIVWWPVTTSGGLSGWVSNEYLAADSVAKDTKKLVPVIQSLLFASSSPETLAGTWLPLSRPHELGVFVGGSLTKVPPDQLDEAVGWHEPVIDAGGKKRSLAELLSVPAPLRPEQLVIALGSGAFVDPALQAVADGYFGGLSFGSAKYLGADGQPHVTHVFFEITPREALVVGLIVETGQP